MVTDCPHESTFSPAEESTGELVSSVARALRRRWGLALEQYDVTPAQSRALRVIVARPSIRPSVLAEELHVSPRSATEVIDGLEVRGLVTRRPDPTDRRATEIVPTDEGRLIFEAIHEVREAESERFFETLPAADRAELDRLLRLLATSEAPPGRG